VLLDVACLEVIRFFHKWFDVNYVKSIYNNLVIDQTTVPLNVVKI